MSADDFQAVTDWLASNPHWLAFALFAAAFSESLALVGIVIPGVALLFAIAAFAGQTAMPLLEVLLWTGAGAIAGDGVSFALGRLFHGRLDRLWPLNRYPKLIVRGEQFFQRHGGKSVIIGRFVGPVRPVIPLVAGAFMMPWRRFLTFNLCSAVGWAPVYILPGYLVGSAIAAELEPPAHFYPVMAISVAILATVYLLLFRFQLGLARGSLIYDWLAEQMERYNTTHHVWRLYSSQRPHRAGEFPLASLMFGLGSLALFILVSQLTLSTDLLTAYDRLAAQWLQELRHPILDGVFVAITLMGDRLVLASAALLAIAVLLFRGFYWAGVHVAVASVLTALSVWIFKDIASVDRPDLVITPPASGAYPSGHAAGIALACSLLASFVAAETRRGRRWQYYLILTLPLVLVAFSRAYLGVHWVTDVTGGILLGLAITGLIRTSFSRFDNEPITVEATMMTAIFAWFAFSAAYVIHQWPAAMARYAPV